MFYYATVHITFLNILTEIDPANILAQIYLLVTNLPCENQICP